MALSLSGLALSSGWAADSEVPQEVRERLVQFYLKIFKAEVSAATRAPGNEAPPIQPADPAEWVQGMKTLIAEKMNAHVFGPIAKEVKRLLEAEKQHVSWTSEEERQAQILSEAVRRAEYFVTVPKDLADDAQSLHATVRQRVSQPLSISAADRAATALLDERTFGEAEKDLRRLTSLIEGEDAAEVGQALLERAVWGQILRSFNTADTALFQEKAQQAFAAAGRAYVRREAKAQGADPEQVLERFRAQAGAELSLNFP